MALLMAPLLFLSGVVAFTAILRRSLAPTVRDAKIILVVTFVAAGSVTLWGIQVLGNPPKPFSPTYGGGGLAMTATAIGSGMAPILAGLSICLSWIFAPFASSLTLSFFGKTGFGKTGVSSAAQINRS